MATRKEIARKVGVSARMASRVLSGKGRETGMAATAGGFEVIA